MVYWLDIVQKTPYIGYKNHVWKKNSCIVNMYQKMKIFARIHEKLYSLEILMLFSEFYKYKFTRLGVYGEGK